MTKTPFGNAPTAGTGSRGSQWLDGQRAERVSPLTSAFRRLASDGDQGGNQTPMSPDELELQALRADLAGARANAREEGRQEGKLESQAAREQLSKAAVLMSQALHRQLRSDAHLIVDLALEGASGILGREFAADTDALVALVKHSLTMTGNALEPIVRVNPAEEAAVAIHIPPNVKLEVDPGLGRGEVRVETERAVIDGTLAARLGAIRDGLVEVLEHGPVIEDDVDEPEQDAADQTAPKDGTEP